MPSMTVMRHIRRSDTDLFRLYDKREGRYPCQGISLGYCPLAASFLTKSLISLLTCVISLKNSCAVMREMP